MREPKVPDKSLGQAGAARWHNPHAQAAPALSAEQRLAALQRAAGNRAVGTVLRQHAPKSPGVVAWTGDPVSMAKALRDQLVAGQHEETFASIAASLSGMWIRDIVDTLRALRMDAGAWGPISSSRPFTSNPRLASAVAVANGQAPEEAGLPADWKQKVELTAMADVERWPQVIGPDAPPLVLAPTPEVPGAPPDPRRDPEYHAALYDAIRRNRALASRHPLRPKNAGHIYVGPSHPGEQPKGMAADDPKRKAVNEAVWRELGIGEGTQSSINTWDNAKFSLGPGFAATGLLPKVMDKLAGQGEEILTILRRAGFHHAKSGWYVVDPDARTVATGRPALDVIAKDVGLLNTFLDTTDDPKLRQQWMNAQWEVLTGPEGAAAVPDNVVRSWNLSMIVFVAHCVHWLTARPWTKWAAEPEPTPIGALRTMVPLLQLLQKTDDPRMLTAQAAQTILGFSGGLLRTQLAGRDGGGPGPLPDDWATGHQGAIALPLDPKRTRFFVVEADEP
ncbi:hypothetical protein ACQEVF_52725 [Nonomuraea polychroma]|uniref:hypothetical protein n=1 Tax=Nonomuraea polychroma TaxID=46176 RepID=UPI003D8B7D48